MKIPTLKLASAIALALGAPLGCGMALAATPLAGDILTITAGVPVIDANGNQTNVSPGSYFGMDNNGNAAISGAEKTALSQGTTGLVIGTATTAGASHGGAVTAGDTNAITAPWGFFGNTGSDYTTVGITGSTTAGLNFSGWTVTWNSIPAINMGGTAWGTGFSNGVANFVWDGNYGSTYTLDYHATVPDGDVSGFGGVKYAVRLEGVVQSGNAAPVAADISTSTQVDTPLAIDLTTEVTDADGTIDWATLSVSCSSGTATDDNLGTVTFTPAGATENTTANCTYSVDDNDAAVSNTATLDIGITAVSFVNTPPTASGDTLNVTEGGSDPWIPGVADVDGFQTLTCTTASAPTYGTVTFAAGCASATYQHDGSVSTNDMFTYTVTDGIDTSAAATVNVNITALPNVAPTATDFTASAVRTTPASIDFTSRVSDSDGTVDWSTLSVTCTSGTATDNNAGTVTYTAAANFVGTDSCNYSVSDNEGAVSNTATLSVTVSASATGGVLPAGAVVLQMDPGQQILLPDGSKGNVEVGSWFGMDSDGNTRMAGSEKTPLLPGPDGGLRIGVTQAASGTHSGAPDGSENPSVDAPWNYFGNTGLDFTETAPVAINGNTANGIDMSGWRVTWNSIPSINLGTGAWTPGNCDALNITTCSFTNGTAQFTWTDVDTSGGISDGDSYRLIYAATVPPGDVSGFGGVRYLLNLEGTIAVTPAPTASVGTLLDGDFGGTATNAYRATETLPVDTGYSNVGGYFDYKVDCGSAGVGCSSDVTIALTSPISTRAVLRKYGVTPGNTAGGWDTFDTTGGDAIASGASVGGDCTVATYSTGLTAGHDCLRITQADGGLNDTDPTAGIIGDPSGIAVPTAAAVAPDLSSGSSGCTLSNRPVSIGAAGDWLLVGAALAGLGLLRRRVF